jgi:ubiquinone/menaquinone biosynthesis C-methylase UbiE
MEDTKLKLEVRYFYDKLALEGAGQTCCASCTSEVRAIDLLSIGYTPREIWVVPAEARLSLGCCNVPALADLKPGERVLDVGCGAGLDVFLSARKVGREGLVIGVDVSPSLLGRAKVAKLKSAQNNVEFFLSDAEKMPYRDEVFDVVISNCVVNLIPRKLEVFREISRVVKKGGRICISDVIAVGELAEEIRKNTKFWAACVAGAVDESKYLEFIESVGFTDIKVLSRKVFKYGPADVRRFVEYFKGDVEGLKTALSLEGKIGSLTLLAYKR